MFCWTRSRRWIGLCGLAASLSWPFFCSSSVQAQGFKLAWEQPEAPNVVATYSYTLKVDAAAPVSITPTCVAAVGIPGALTTCTMPAPTLPSGSHTLVITASNAFGSASSAPLAGGPPSTPMNIRIVIDITIK